MILGDLTSCGSLRLCRCRDSHVDLLYTSRRMSVQKSPEGSPRAPMSSIRLQIQNICCTDYLGPVKSASPIVFPYSFSSYSREVLSPEFMFGCVSGRSRASYACVRGYLHDLAASSLVMVYSVTNPREMVSFLVMSCQFKIKKVNSLDHPRCRRYSENIQSLVETPQIPTKPPIGYG